MLGIKSAYCRLVLRAAGEGPKHRHLAADEGGGPGFQTLITLSNFGLARFAQFHYVSRLLPCGVGVLFRRICFAGAGHFSLF